jgi:NADH-ubiquinone oxidoreductase chain 1
LIIKGLVEFFILIAMVLVSVAFFTLLERKLLGYIQVRKGPNKVGVIGILQPFRDAIKLLIKEIGYLLTWNIMVYYLRPVLRILIFLLIWILYPKRGGGVNLFFGVCLYVGLAGLIIYCLLGIG